MIWNSDPLFEKAAVYFARAYSADREGDEFPLYLTLGFELLARAALARVHPALLADPAQGENLMFAFGFAGPAKGQPKSIPMKSVLHRLVVVVDDFSDDDFKFATSVIEVRNGELHSADMPFESFGPGIWLPQLLRISNVLCLSMGKSLEDLVGVADAKTATEMIEGLDDVLKGEALKAVASAKSAFDTLDEENQTTRYSLALEYTEANAGWADRKITCPACGSDALLKGKALRVVDTVATEGEIEEKTEVMPTALHCEACGLSLSKNGHLFHLGLGALYMATDTIDPVDYFGIEFDPSDYFEPEYGND